MYPPFPFIRRRGYGRRCSETRFGLHTRLLLIFMTALFASSDSAKAVEELNIDDVLVLERNVSAIQRKEVHCLLGYEACLVYLKRLAGKVAVPTRKAGLALVEPFRKKTLSSAILPLVPSEIYRLDDRKEAAVGGTANSKPYIPPNWAVLQPSDLAFYERVWADGVLNIALFLGYKDQGTGRNPRLFNYGVYAATSDKIHRFAEGWGVSWRRIDDVEMVGEVKLSAGRLVRLRVFDPHVFCTEERIKIGKIEADDIKRGASGALLRLVGPATFTRSREAPCDHQAAATKLVKQRFLDALRGSGSGDIVFYDGHSRFGRGPDFGPIKSGLGEVKPEEMQRATLASPNLSAIYFNGCSGEKNYGAYFRKAIRAGKVVVWNTHAPNMLDGTDDLFLFADGVLKGRPFAAIERHLNLTQFDGRWPSTVRIGVNREKARAQ